MVFVLPIESSYRDRSSDGWQWHKTRSPEAARAERLWLAMAVATSFWTVTMGSEEPQHLWETLKDKGIADDNIPQKSELKKTNRNRRLFFARIN